MTFAPSHGLVPLLAASLIAASPAHAASVSPASAPVDPAADAKAADSRGFGDDQFAKMMQRAAPEASTVPALSALYDAAAKTAPARANLAFAMPPRPAGPVSGGAVRLAASPLPAARLTSAFGLRLHPVLGGLRAHKGVDLAAPAGTPIRATADGVITQAAWSGGYGLMVAIDHGGRTETRYGHMSRLAVVPGQQVARDTVIGYVGSTGRSTGPHLHYEVLIDGRAVDPFTR